MQMVKNTLLPLLVAYIAFLIFMPKAELYFLLEKELEKNDITLNEKSIDEGWFTLNVNEITVYVKGVQVANIEELNYFTLFFYNTIELRMLKVDDLLKSKVPTKTTELELIHSIFSPLTVAIDANGSFGVIEGEFHLGDNVVHLDFIEEKEINMILPLLKKDEKGRYYEKSF